MRRLSILLSCIQADLEFTIFSDAAIPRDVSQKIQRHFVLNKSAQGEMWNKTRFLLQSFFHPRNKQLSVLLRDEKWLWVD